MTGDMTVKEYAYFILVREGKIRESTLKRMLQEVYQESCVDCILRELHEDKHIHVQTIYYNDTTDYQLYLNMEVPL
jgi:hypothetical protein